MEYDLLTIKRDIRYKPFLSFTTLRIIALILFGITQIIMAAYILSFTFVIPIEQLDSDKAANILDIISNIFSNQDITEVVGEYKLLISIWPIIKTLYSISRVVPPLLIMGLFASLIQRPKKIKRMFIQYLIMTLLLFFLELFFYFQALDSLLLEVAEVENINVSLTALAGMLIKNVMLFSANLNIFLDMLIAIIFFKFYMLPPKSKFFIKHKKIYRAFSIFPILYILLSTLLIGFQKVGYFSLPLALNSLLSARGIYVYALFFSMCFYFRYRFPIMRETGIYIKTLHKSNLELFNFTVYICLVLLALALISKGLSHSKIMVSFRFDFAKGYYYLIPLVLFYNYTIKPRFRFLTIFYGLYYILLFMILFIIYIVILRYVMEVFIALSNMLG